MENLNLHKQKLYSLIAAAIALITLILPWQTYSVTLGGFGGFDFGGGGGMGRSGSANGFRGWGWLSFLGIIGVVVASLMGDKTKPYDDTFKKVALGSFGVIALGAIIFYDKSHIRKPRHFQIISGFWIIYMYCSCCSRSGLVNGVN